jgi:hypothetical protein
MTTNLQTTPYLPRQRNFPNDSPQKLGVELDKTYIEIASRVNERTIGIYAVNFPIVTGNKWYLQGEARIQQTLRQVYTFVGPGPVITINHGIKVFQTGGFVQIYGTFTDNANPTLANWYPLPFVSTIAIANQVSVQVTQTQIIITDGAGAPVIVSGFVVLEWLSTIATNS